ncbi:hypothetical protein HU200_037431 [Digitaria exilis]|uniref:C2 domain-containing protein n=1 Tax=Digitaria exilis TaxID=1010633 RepID=A0A835BLW1_9POAL|nr:hypothetical protein HU200_037431 [Digitaria exilis]
MSSLPGFLSVRVLRGINLVSRDAKGSDPYVVLNLDGQEVFDKDTFSKDDEMGDAEFDIEALMQIAGWTWMTSAAAPSSAPCARTGTAAWQNESHIIWENGQAVRISSSSSGMSRPASCTSSSMGQHPELVAFEDQMPTRDGDAVRNVDPMLPFVDLKPSAPTVVTEPSVTPFLRTYKRRPRPPSTAGAKGSRKTGLTPMRLDFDVVEGPLPPAASQRPLVSVPEVSCKHWEAA